MIRIRTFLAGSLALSLALAAPASAQQQQVTVTVRNLAPTNSISFAPTHLGFHRGVFDAFNDGQTPGAGIISVAEGGAGDVWQSDFALADPTAVRGTIGMALLPGQSRSQSFLVNSALNPFFSFASMVVPSNDFFVGNDNPQAFRLFDAMGNLLINRITQTSSQIWDAGSEAFSIAGAAFLVNGVNAVRTPQNGVVSFNFAELAGFNGEQTAANYAFDSQLTANQAVYQIDFVSSTVPEPSTVVLLASGLMTMALVVRRRRVRG
ncbi:spondin domain-containing protein [Gemmatimonas groenlandica]|uniref:PEP-CTERM sorting domain-containing protein n=1 Tax=Gemmatimonas groenlandica TaxID=2732249 RepID=A0A6M4IWB4_9BACT|nr:spondin domain-containing protein [Gemmatimonas groenlandica]QJR37897.1 PEP-CTERM sorting domain-containing protein [Gemmatimonas groenlandica]